MSINWIAFWDNAYRSFGVLHEKPDAMVARTVPLLRAAGVKNVLDVGSGTGRHAALLAEYGFQVVALDAAPYALRNAQKKLEEFRQRFGQKLIRQVTRTTHNLVQGMARKERLALERLPEETREAAVRRISWDAVKEIRHALPRSTLPILRRVARNAMVDEGLAPALSGDPKAIETRLTELLRPLYNGCILLVPGDLRRMPFADGHFDCVLSHNVLKFCTGDDFLLGIRESQRVLKPGGISILKITSGLGRRRKPSDPVRSCTHTKPSILPAHSQHFAGKEELLAAHEGYTILDLQLVTSEAPFRGHRFAKGTRLDWWLVTRKPSEGKSAGPEIAP